MTMARTYNRSQTLGRSRIEWAVCPNGRGAFNWGVVSGCRNNCAFPCWARSMVKRFPARYPNGFEPTFHPDKLDDNLLVPAGDTVLCSIMGDLFSPGVEFDWQERVFNNMGTWPEPTYLLLTKRPDNIPDDLYLGADAHPNLWLGTSVESGAIEHYRRIGQLERVDVAHRFVSFEPLTGGLFLFPSDLEGISWCIIGSLTGPGAKPPECRWVRNIIDAAECAGVPVFVKDNILKHFPEFWQYRALPYLETR